MGLMTEADEQKSNSSVSKISFSDSEARDNRQREQITAGAEGAKRKRTGVRALVQSAHELMRVLDANFFIREGARRSRGKPRCLLGCSFPLAPTASLLLPPPL